MLAWSVPPFFPVQPALTPGIVQHGHLYREYVPPAALAAAVACFWTIETPGARPHPYPYRAVPDGCIDLVFDVGDAVGAWVFGPFERPLITHLDPRASLFGIRIRPGALATLFGTPAGDLAGGAHDLAVMLGRDGDLWHEALCDVPDTPRRLALAAARLVACSERYGRPEPRAAAVVAGVTDARFVSVAALARTFGLTPRHLGRLCRRATGFGPKRLASIVRVQRALRILRDRPDVAPADVAAALGFVDQAHLGAGLRMLAATTPGRARLSDFS